MVSTNGSSQLLYIFRCRIKYAPRKTGVLQRKPTPRGHATAPLLKPPGERRGPAVVFRLAEAIQVHGNLTLFCLSSIALYLTQELILIKPKAQPDD